MDSDLFLDQPPCSMQLACSRTRSRLAFSASAVASFAGELSFWCCLCR